MPDAGRRRERGRTLLLQLTHTGASTGRSRLRLHVGGGPVPVNGVSSDRVGIVQVGSGEVRDQPRVTSPSCSSTARIWLSHFVPSRRPRGNWSSRSQPHVVIIASTRILHSRNPQRARRHRGGARALILAAERLCALLAGVLDIATPGSSLSRRPSMVHDPLLADQARHARTRYAAAPHPLVAVRATAIGPTLPAARAAAAPSYGVAAQRQHRPFRGGDDLGAARVHYRESAPFDGSQEVEKPGGRADRGHRSLAMSRPVSVKPSCS
jgi:hypothetical protein